jgi:L-fuconolactonase
MLDAHVHLWDTQEVSYRLFDDDPDLGGRHDADAYFAEAAGLGVDRILVVEAASAGADGLAEARWQRAELAGDERVAGVVAWAPLESPRLDEHLGELGALDGLPVVGLRRSFEFEDPGFASTPEVVRGARLAGARGLVVDVVLFSRSLAAAIELVRAAPETQFVLDHLGKPPVADGALEPWAAQIEVLAQLPNVVAKLSGLVTEAGADWSAGQLAPYVTRALECFGPERLMLGSDWPIVRRAGGLASWFVAVDTLLAGLAPATRALIQEGTARRVYAV